MKLTQLSSFQTLRIATLIALLSPLTTTLAQSADRVVAMVNGKAIRQADVDNLQIAQVMPLEEQLYAIRKAALENLVVSLLLEEEASRRGVSLEELRKILTAGNIEVGVAEVENAYLDNASAFGAMSPDEAKERLRLDLETQARMARYRKAVAELREKAAVEIVLPEPRWPLVGNDDHSPALGAKESPITIIEFADFQCPYCRESQHILKQVLKAYENQVRLVFKHLPLEIHPDATVTARAAFCAGEQGRFWQYHDGLFAMDSFSPAALRKAAGELKLDLEKFDACLSSDASHNAVAHDKKEAARWSIDSTPTFIVNGKILKGAIDFATFKAVIEKTKTSIHITSNP
jgi:protein-disulfide isomerase